MSVVRLGDVCSTRLRRRKGGFKSLERDEGGVMGRSIFAIRIYNRIECFHECQIVECLLEVPAAATSLVLGILQTYGVPRKHGRERERFGLWTLTTIPPHGPPHCPLTRYEPIRIQIPPRVGASKWESLPNRGSSSNCCYECRVKCEPRSE